MCGVVLHYGPAEQAGAHQRNNYNNLFRLRRIEPHKGKDTKPEMLVRRFLHANGFRYKLHDKSLPGKPDIVIPKYKTVINLCGTKKLVRPAGRIIMMLKPIKTKKDYEDALARFMS